MKKTPTKPKKKTAATKRSGAKPARGKTAKKTSAATTNRKWKLRLYVAGQTPKSLAAFANLKRLCEQNLAGKYQIEVIDLLENPELAQGDQIMAVPTLVRKMPAPIKKIIGNLANADQSIIGLEMQG